MARFNEILVGSYNRTLQKVFGMKGPPVAPQLASEVQPVFPFPHGKENHYHLGWNHFAGIIAVGAQGAGLIGGIKLRNPKNSNVIIVIYQWWFMDIVNLVQEQFVIAYAHTNPASNQNNDLTLNNPPFLSEDVRAGGGQFTQQGGSGTGSVGLISSGSLTATPPPIGHWRGSITGGDGKGYIRAIANTEDEKFVLAPNDAIMGFSLTANNSFTSGLRWKERLLEDSELI
jgi:hypothetical protein